MALRAALLSYLQGRFVDFGYLWEVRFRLYCAVVAGHGAFMHSEEEAFEDEGEPIVPSEDFTDIESLTRFNHVARLFSRWLGDGLVNGIQVVGELVQYRDDNGRLRNRNWGQLVEELYNLVQREGYSTDLDATMDGLVLCVFCLAHYGDDEAYFGQQDVLGGPAIRHFARMFLLSLGGPPQNPLVDVATQVEAVAEAIDAATQVDAQDLEEAEAEAEAVQEQQQEPDSSQEEEQQHEPEEAVEEMAFEADVSAKDVRTKRQLQSEIEEAEDEEVYVDEDGDVTMGTETETETEEVVCKSRSSKRRRILKLSYEEESLRAEKAKRNFGLRDTPARKKWLVRLKEADDAKRKSDEADGSSEGSRKRSRR